MTMKSIMRLRPHRVVHDQDGGSGQLTNGGCGFWSNLPPEILREILIRLEASARSWPTRRSLVACAGVCRSWRFVAKEVVPIPEISGRLTFPISVKQPGTRDHLIRCFIKRSRSALTYQLYLNITDGLIDEGKLLLSAQKCKKATCTDYIISLCNTDKTMDNTTCIGKLRSNFIGTKFTILDEQPPLGCPKMTRSHSSRLANFKRVSPVSSSGSHAIAHILYELNVLGVRGPRRMQCVMDSIPATAIEPGGLAPTQTEFCFRNTHRHPAFRLPHSMKDSLYTPWSCRKEPDALVLRNKSPRWHENLQCWCLNFHGRVTVASVKNFQLLACEGRGNASAADEIILQFGKVEKDIYTMDYRYPLSAFQAFAICLSSFDTKIACE